MTWYTVSKAPRGGGHITETEAPNKTGHLIENIKIKPDVIQEYTLKLEFKETQVNQDENQGKMFSGKIQINNTQNELAGELFAQNEVQTEIPDFSLASPDSDGVDHWKGLFVSEDDDGPSFYFRGAVDNNNVRFAEMDWKILRVNGDGSIRLILDGITGLVSKFNDYIIDSPNALYEGFTYNNTIEKECTKNHPCEVTYDKEKKIFSNDNFGGTNSDIKTALETWYSQNLNDYDDKITSGYFCNDTSYYSGTDDENITQVFYGTMNRVAMKKPSLECPNPSKRNGTFRTYGGIYITKIGLITADEMLIAGIAYSSMAGATNYLYHDYDWWSMSPVYNVSSAVYLYLISRGGATGNGNAKSVSNVVPVINLKEDVKFSIPNPELPPGTTDNPYIIE